MAVNLSKNKDEMLKAWSDVVDDKFSTDWALYGYDKQTNDLKLISTGEDGLEELCDEFNSGKIMYAFCRVFDSKTSLPKFVLVNWQGEGAPTIRKGNCAHHIHDVKKFFKGIHIMVNARTDEEVEPEVILEKVSKSTGSSYNFKQRSSAEDQNQPVASVYKRVLPKTEINSNERDKFWEEQEKEEKQRLAEEQKKFAEQRKKLEDERKERECKETAAREEIVKERSRSINEMRKAEKLVEQSESTKVVNKEKWNRQLQEDMKDEEIRKKRSESLRDERNQETQQLISQRTIDARAVFEQNTNAGQMVSRKNSGARSNSLSSPTEVTSSPVDIGKEESIAKKQEEPITQVAEQVVETKEITYTRNLLKEGLPPRLNSDVEDEEESNWDEPPLEDPPKFDSPFDLIKDTNQPQTVSTDSHVQANEVKVDEKCIKARALYDYQAVDDTEISFDPDDIISNIEMIDEGWWQGVGPDGTFGLFPANYVEVIE